MENKSSCLFVTSYVPFQSGNSTPLKPVILEEILSNAKSRIRALVARESDEPRNHLKIYDKYHMLISKQVFLLDFNQTLDQCVVQVVRSCLKLVVLLYHRGDKPHVE